MNSSFLFLVSDFQFAFAVMQLLASLLVAAGLAGIGSATCQAGTIGDAIFVTVFANFEKNTGSQEFETLTLLPGACVNLSSNMAGFFEG